MTLPFPEMWTSFGIPGLREFDQTYKAIPLAETPALSVPDTLEWLPPIDPRLIEKMDQNRWRGSPPSAPSFERTEKGPDIPSDNQRKAVEMILAQASAAGVVLPAASIALVQSDRMQNRMLDPTGCYFDLPEQGLTRDPFGLGGHIVRFQNDQQCCVMWYLFVPPSGMACVLASEGTKHADFLEELDPEDDEHIRSAIKSTWLCAHSFAEFLYRFWIEGSLYYKLKYGAPLSSADEQYAAALRRLDDAGPSA